MNLALYYFAGAKVGELDLTLYGHDAWKAMTAKLDELAADLGVPADAIKMTLKRGGK